MAKIKTFYCALYLSKGGGEAEKVGTFRIHDDAGVILPGSPYYSPTKVKGVVLLRFNLGPDGRVLLADDESSNFLEISKDPERGRIAVVYEREFRFDLMYVSGPYKDLAIREGSRMSVTSSETWWWLWKFLVMYGVLPETSAPPV